MSSGDRSGFLEFLRGCRRTAAFGRTFPPEESMPGAPAVMAACYDYWIKSFGGESPGWGEQDVLDERRVTHVIGFGGPRFCRKYPGRETMCTCQTTRLSFPVAAPRRANRQATMVQVVGRIGMSGRNGSASGGQADLSGVAANLTPEGHTRKDYSRGE